MIEGTVACLRPPNDADFPFLGRLRSDEPLQRLMASRARGSSQNQVRAWVERLQSDARSLFFVVAKVAGEEPAGYLQITDMDLVNRNALLGICIAPEYQGQGLGADCLGLIEQYLSRVWNIRKLTLHVLAANDTAVELYRRHGFAEVGVHSGHFFYDGEFEDVLVMEHLFA